MELYLGLSYVEHLSFSDGLIFKPLLTSWDYFVAIRSTFQLTMPDNARQQLHINKAKLTVDSQLMVANDN